MLTIEVRNNELWNEETETFESEFEFKLDLEHSLVSLSKWEQKHEKPFLGEGEKTDEEVFDYIKCMVVTPVFPPEVFSYLSSSNIEQINDYINAKSTATWFADERPGINQEVITSELVYYWMVAFNIPFECQNWHLTRLFTLIKICNIKNQKPKKMNRTEMIQERARLNAERRNKFNTKG